MLYHYHDQYYLSVLSLFLDQLYIYLPPDVVIENDALYIIAQYSETYL